MKVLIAEDDPTILHSLSTILEREGYQVLTAKDGEHALELWTQHGAQLVCLDIMMPKMDGYTVCKLIREKDPEVPVLFLSAKTDETAVVMGLELGANDFIRKPFGQHEFLARVRAALRNQKQAQQSTSAFHFGDWTVLPDELRAKQAEQQIDLSPRELSLLSYFKQQTGKAVSRDQLLNACWGMDFFPESRLLDQQISRLRKKLNDCNSELIQSVRGVGYRFEG